MTNLSKAVEDYLSAKSLLAESKDLDRILYAKAEVKKAIRELTKFQESETDAHVLNMIETILNN